jgi:hypothetical protein
MDGCVMEVMSDGGAVRSEENDGLIYNVRLS